MDDTAEGSGNIATMKSCVTNINGRAIGIANNNSFLDSREYEIEMENKTTDRLFSNKIPENIYPQLGNEGREIMKLKEIIDHQKNG